eukprot:248319-Pelagomonas_calceolata.AAC.3
MKGLLAHKRSTQEQAVACKHAYKQRTAAKEPPWQTRAGTKIWTAGLSTCARESALSLLNTAPEH